MNTTKVKRRTTVSASPPVQTTPSPQPAVSPIDQIRQMRAAKQQQYANIGQSPKKYPMQADPDSPSPSLKFERDKLSSVTAMRHPASRAPKRQISSGPVQRVLPKPSSKVYRGEKNFRAFLKYWHDLDPKTHLPVLVVHVYRQWPVIDRGLTGNKHSSIHRFEVTNDPASSAACPFSLEDWRSDLLHRFGSGGYKFLLNELGVPHPLVQAEVFLEDADYPPLLDMRELLVDHPMNKAYVDRLRREGVKLPGEEESDDMGNMDSLRVIDTVLNAADKLNSNKKNEPPSVEQQAISAGMNIVNQAAQMGMRIMEKGIDARSAQTDPLEMLEKVSSIVGAKKGDDALTLQLMQQAHETNQRFLEMQATNSRDIARIQEEHAREMRDLLLTLSKRSDDAPAPKSRLDQLRETLEEKKILRELMDDEPKRRRRDDEEEEEKKNPSDEIIVQLVKNAPAIIQGVMGLVGMGINVYMQMKNPQQQAPAPAGGPQAAQGPGDPSQGAQSQQGQNPAQVAGLPQQQTITGPNGEQIPLTGDPEQDMEMKKMLNMMSNIQSLQQPLLAHFYGEGTDGLTFAEYVISGGFGAGPTPEGRRFYEELKSFGQEKILMFLKTQAVWEKIGTVPGKAEKFLEEFLNYDEIMAEQEREDDRK